MQKFKYNPEVKKIRRKKEEKKKNPN